MTQTELSLIVLIMFVASGVTLLFRLHESIIKLLDELREKRKDHG